MMMMSSMRSTSWQREGGGVGLLKLSPGVKRDPEVSLTIVGCASTALVLSLREYCS
jgi:hypothetical protein